MAFRKEKTETMCRAISEAGVLSPGKSRAEVLNRGAPKAGSLGCHSPILGGGVALSKMICYVKSTISPNYVGKKGSTVFL